MNPELPSFADLAAAEPALGKLLGEAFRLRSDRPADYCQTATWAAFKRRLERYVGPTRPGRRHELLSRDAAWAEAVVNIRSLLPSCRGGCQCGSQRYQRSVA